MAVNEPDPPLLLRSMHDRSTRLLVERAWFGDAHVDGVRITCIAEESDRCQGIFLQPIETVPLMVALLDRLSMEGLRRVLEATHARYIEKARRDAEWFASRDGWIDRDRGF